MNTRVKGAILVGGALVAAAFILARYQQPTPQPAANPVVAEGPSFVSESPLRQYIPVTDSNGDGIPDWQELLDNTEPLELPTSTTAYTEPETLTDQFALDFFETYVRNEGFGAFGRNPNTLIEQASSDLIRETRDPLYTEQNITLYPATAAQIRTYANAVADIMFAYPLPEGTQNEVLILEQAVAENDAALLTELTPIREAYEGMVRDMLALPVPERFMKAHLDLTNAYQALATSVAAMEQTFTDPLRSLLRLQRYQQDADGLAAAVVNLFTAANESGANFLPEDSVFDVVEFR
ncbi:hypothetical protein CL655_02250 [bacterium]|nr:hypothetical protein [bacterium]|tara:strand:- start:13288 stop:14169 length:882 start_codon:yes stop_codon:yes gene_type:complete